VNTGQYIAALRQANAAIQRQADKIAELEKAREELLQRTECSVESFNMEAHNLDQRAKALSEFKFKRSHTQTILENLSEGSYSQEDHDLVYEELKAVEIILSNAANELTGQAKALKDPK
jgi:hypothetical protein